MADSVRFRAEAHPFQKDFLPGRSPGVGQQTGAADEIRQAKKYQNLELCLREAHIEAMQFDAMQICVAQLNLKKPIQSRECIASVSIKHIYKLEQFWNFVYLHFPFMAQLIFIAPDLRKNYFVITQALCGLNL